MATSGRPVLTQSIHTYMRDGNRTTKRHARYGQLYLNSQLVGGVQMFNYRETNGTHLEPEGGSDYNEIVVGQRQFTVTCRRHQVRGSDIPEMVRNEFPDVQDVDFRDLPFVLRYHYLYTSATNKTVFEDATWHYSDICVNDYQAGYDSPVGLLTENFTAVSRGYSFSDSGKQGRNVAKALLGN